MGLDSAASKPRFDLSDLGYFDDSRISEMNMLCGLAARSTSADMALMGIADDAAGRIRLKGTFGVGQETLNAAVVPVATSMIGWVRENARPIDRNFSLDDELPEDLKRFRALGFLGAPIFGPAGEPIGAFAVLSHSPRKWTTSDRRSIMDAASLASGKVLMRAALETLKLLSKQGGEGLPVNLH